MGVINLLAPMRPPSCTSLYSPQSGQALTEVLAGFSVIALFLFGAQHIWRHAEAQQAATEAVRFAAWERTVWEPSDNQSEKHALHKTDLSLAGDTVMRQLSTPAALRAYHDSVGASGQVEPRTAALRRNDLLPALKVFVEPGQDPAVMLSLNTTSGWPDQVESTFRGRDPTFNTTTSLVLDRETYRTVTMRFASLLGSSERVPFFGFLMQPVALQKKLSLITNSWAASPPMMRIRTVRELLPFSSGDAVSGTPANRLAFFGLNDDPNAFNAADLAGMTPWWNFLGGPNGLGGQFVVRQIGLDANGANALIHSSGHSFSFSPADPAASLLLRAEVYQNEFFDANYARSMQHRHEAVIDKTAEQTVEDEGGPKSRNANSGKRKYRAVSLQNPVDTYFAE